MFLVFKLCFCNAYHEEDYNTVVETSATNQELVLKRNCSIIIQRLASRIHCEVSSISTGTFQTGCTLARMIVDWAAGV